VHSGRGLLSQEGYWALYRVTLSTADVSVLMGRATVMYFHEFDSAGRAQEDLRSGWEEARKVTSILVDAATPKDGYTAEHAVEVARLSRLVGMDLGLNEDELEALVQGALLHDLGKLGVADAILEKPSSLTEEEWAVVKRHPEIGARMIEPIESLSGAVPVVRHHHERPDGTGYPDGLEGEQIPHSRSGGRLRRDASGQALPAPTLPAQEFTCGSSGGAGT
jgi:HD-GYP domain-containing protein (c-di-GMP phosphodiesterase class II)